MSVLPIGVALMLLPGWFAAGSNIVDTSFAISPREIAVADSQGDCGFVCSTNCSIPFAHATFPDSGGASIGPKHSCDEGAGYLCSGGDGHDSHGCGPDFANVGPEEIGKIWKVLQNQNASELIATVGAYADAVHVNRERKSLQVLGCNNDVIASAPLTDAQLELLTE